MRGEEGRNLPVHHAIKLAAPIELICAFAESEHGRVGVKADCAIRAVIEGEFLHEPSIRAAHGERKWLRLDRDSELSHADFLFTGKFADAEFLSGRKSHKDRGWRCRAGMSLFIQCGKLNPHRASTDFTDYQLGFLSGELNRCGGDKVLAQRQTQRQKK